MITRRPTAFEQLGVDNSESPSNMGEDAALLEQAVEAVLAEINAETGLDSALHTENNGDQVDQVIIGFSQ